jgi:transcriptional regulator with XRE-family HTH domain
VSPSSPERSPEWDDYARHIGVRLHRRRVFLKLTQEEVAYAAGLTRSHYQLLERGLSRPDTSANPSLKTLVNLAEALDMDLVELLHREG